MKDQHAQQHPPIAAEAIERMTSARTAARTSAPIQASNPCQRGRVRAAGDGPLRLTRPLYVIQNFSGGFAVTDGRVRAVRSELSARAGWGGDTLVRVGPLGTLTLDTHDGPLAVTVSVEALNVADARQLFENPHSASAPGDHLLEQQIARSPASSSGRPESTCSSGRVKLSSGNSETN